MGGCYRCFCGFKNLPMRGRSSTLNVLFRFPESGRGRGGPRGTSCTPGLRTSTILTSLPSSPSAMAPISKLTLHEAVPYWYLYTNQFHELHFGKLQTQRISWIVFHVKTIKILISFPSLKCLPSSLPAWAVWRTWQTCWKSHWCTLEAGSRNFEATGTAQSSLGHIQILFKVS